MPAPGKHYSSLAYNVIVSCVIMVNGACRIAISIYFIKFKIID